MITYHPNENIFDSKAQALVNPVNCVGVAGKGLALEFKKRFPENHAIYENTCRVGCMQPGIVVPFFTSEKGDSRYIFNFPTKQHWRDQSHIEWIHAGLDSLVMQTLYRNLYSLAVPRLGCGLGGLQWLDVHAAMREHFAAFSNDICIEIYGPRVA